MMALDTNVLARFYVDDPGDPEAAKQRPTAYRLLTESAQVFVPLTVVLEFEWKALLPDICEVNLIPTSLLELQK